MPNDDFGTFVPTRADRSPVYVSLKLYLAKPDANSVGDALYELQRLGPAVIDGRRYSLDFGTAAHGSLQDLNKARIVSTPV